MSIPLHLIFAACSKTVIWLRITSRALGVACKGPLGGAAWIAPFLLCMGLLVSVCGQVLVCQGISRSP